MASEPSSGRITGSCACGRVRFSATNPEATVHCYCTTCRKTSGAAYLPFAHFREDNIRWENEPDKWAKSDNATRAYCATCGSCISMSYHGDPEIGIAVGCIDEGVDLINPVKMCIYVREKPAWAQLPQGVPAFDGGSTEG